MTLYICTKFQENISKGFRVNERTHTENLQRGINSIRNVDGVTVLVLCTSPDNALYFSKVLLKYLKGSLSYRLKLKGSTLGWLQFTMGHNSVKNCTWSYSTKSLHII